MANLMAVQSKYSKLHAYFLTVCAKDLLKLLHRDHNVPKNGKGMLQFLIQTLPCIYGKAYSNLNVASSFLTTPEKLTLLPGDGVEINTGHLDVALYIKILQLLKKIRKSTVRIWPGRKWCASQ